MFSCWDPRFNFVRVLPFIFLRYCFPLFFPGCSRFQWRQPWPTFRFIPSYDKADFAPLLPDNSAKVPQNMIYSPLIKWMQSQNSIISVYRRQWIFIMKRNIMLHFHGTEGHSLSLLFNKLLSLAKTCQYNSRKLWILSNRLKCRKILLQLASGNHCGNTLRETGGHYYGNTSGSS